MLKLGALVFGLYCIKLRSICPSLGEEEDLIGRRMIKRQGKRAGDAKHPSPVDYYLEMSYRTLMRRFDWGYHVDHMFPCSPLGTYVPLPFELLLHIRSTLYHHHYSLYVLPIILTETKPTAKPSTSARRSRLRYHLATTTTKRQMRYIGKNPICLKPTFQQRSKPRVDHV